LKREVKFERRTQGGEKKTLKVHVRKERDDKTDEEKEGAGKESQG